MRRNPSFADIFLVLTPAHLGLHAVDREYAAAVLAFPRVLRPPRPPCLSPPPTAFLKAHARTDHREATISFLGELGGLGTGGDAIHPRRTRNLRATALAPVSLASLRRVHFAMSSGLSSLPTDWDLERVLSAIRPRSRRPQQIREWEQGSLLLRPPRNARQGARLERPRLPLSPFDALLNAQQLYMARALAHPPLAPASYNTPSRRSKRAKNTHAAYNELAASATPTTSRPHPPPRSRPRSAPGHHDLATQALATRRHVPFTSIWFFGDCFLHTPALNARPTHLPAPSQRGLDAHLVLAQRLHLLPPFCAVASFAMLLLCSAATPRNTAP
ncbi:hypothetical protein B0H14DRAFT_3170675 [Mycena olivaceomarginata]|nr:hypothetical protein B0H14DRAFT_3170675 [Mycena olivaceomarginata]